MANQETSKNYKYLFNKVYKNIHERTSGRLYISSYYKKKVAKMLGGNYEDLTKIQKALLCCDIIDEVINLEGGIDYYIQKTE